MLHFQADPALLTAIHPALACRVMYLHCTLAVSNLRAPRGDRHAGGRAQRGDMVRV